MNAVVIPESIHPPALTAHRELPVNLQSEQALLGGLMINNGVFDILPAELESDHFSEPLHRVIFKAGLELRAAERLVNPVSIKGLLPTAIVEQKIGDLTVSQYLARLVRDAVSISQAPDFARAVMDAYHRRALIETATALIEIGYGQGGQEMAEEVSAQQVRLDMTLAGMSGKQAKSLADYSIDALDDTAAAYEGRSLPGVDFDFEPLMQLIGPLMPGHEIIIGGATKQGKSSLIEQIVMGAARNGHPVWVYSGELDGNDLARRAMARLTTIEAWRQARGKVSEIEYGKLDKAREKARVWQERVFIRSDPMSANQIEREVKRFAKSHRDGVVIVDHIGLVERDKTTARMTEQEFGPYMTRVLKQIARANQVPVIAAAQLKKNTFVVDSNKVTKATLQQAISRRPRYQDLIGNCEKDADHVVIPFRPEVILQDLEPHSDSEMYLVWEDMINAARDKAELVLALSRHTRWPSRKDVAWNGKTTMFTEISTEQKGFF